MSSQSRARGPNRGHRANSGDILRGDGVPPGGVHLGQSFEPLGGECANIPDEPEALRPISPSFSDLRAFASLRFVSSVRQRGVDYIRGSSRFWPTRLRDAEEGLSLSPCDARSQPTPTSPSPRSL